MPLVKVNMLAGKTPEFKKTLFQSKKSPACSAKNLESPQPMYLL